MPTATDDTIIVAPDKFKGTLAAGEVADIIAEELRQIYPRADIVAMPMADGGEGTAEALSQINRDPHTHYLDSSLWAGERQRHIADPLKRSSFELGREAAMILRRDPLNKVVVTIGGTMTVDAGLGFVQALGATIVTADGELSQPASPSSARHVTMVDLRTIPDNLRTRISGIADVDLPLHTPGSEESMLMFAPQKGVSGDGMMRLEQFLERLTREVTWLPSTPRFDSYGAGAGGGQGFAISGMLQRPVGSGAMTMIRDRGLFNHPLPKLIITGEGKFDAQSTKGKITGVIMEQAREHGVACIVIAGCVAPGCESSGVYATAAAGVSVSPSEARQALRQTVRKVFGTKQPPF